MSGQNHHISPKQPMEEATCSPCHTYPDFAAFKTIKNTWAYNQPRNAWGDQE